MDPLQFVEVWSRELAQTLEMMAGNAVQTSCDLTPAASVDLCWSNTISASAIVSLTVGAAERTWRTIATLILREAGVDATKDDEVRNTWTELLEQAAGGAVRHLAPEGGRPAESGAGRIVPVPSGESVRVVLSVDGQLLPVFVFVESKVSGSDTAELSMLADAVAKPAGGVQPSRTMEALMDVHLPVSISFGQAKLPLRDVLRLTAGSVVELDRQPEDAVDIIVNDCVIARGEVVVVDGNYAVRIQSIVGRQQRFGLRAGGRGR